MFLDSKHGLNEHMQNVHNKDGKTIGFLCKIQNVLARPSLLTLYKPFIMSHPDYGGIIYDQVYNISFHH